VWPRLGGGKSRRGAVFQIVAGEDTPNAPRAFADPLAFLNWLVAWCTVKEVIAVVKPFLAEQVLEALKFAPLEACTVREVKGFGRQKSYLDQYGDSEYALAFLPKVEIQLWVDDARVDEVVERITAIARTGRMGDGKIFVLPAVEAGLP
jgi:nitrogen regulatory protein PII